MAKRGGVIRRTKPQRDLRVYRISEVKRALHPAKHDVRHATALARPDPLVAAPAPRRSDPRTKRPKQGPKPAGGSFREKFLENSGTMYQVQLVPFQFNCQCMRFLPSSRRSMRLGNTVLLGARRWLMMMMMTAVAMDNITGRHFTARVLIPKAPPMPGTGFTARFRPTDRRTTGPRTTGPRTMDRRTTGLRTMDRRLTGPLPMDHRPMDHRPTVRVPAAPRVTRRNRALPDRA